MVTYLLQGERSEGHRHDHYHAAAGPDGGWLWHQLSCIQLQRERWDADDDSVTLRLFFLLVGDDPIGAFA